MDLMDIFDDDEIQALDEARKYVVPLRERKPNRGFLEDIVEKLCRSNDKLMDELARTRAELSAALQQ